MAGVQQVGASARTQERSVRALAAGTKCGLGVSAVLVVWGTVTMYWPATVEQPGGAVVQCGSAAAPRGDEACATVASRLRLQAVGLYAAAAVVGVTAGAVFGTRPTPG